MLISGELGEVKNHELRESENDGSEDDQKQENDQACQETDLVLERSDPA